MPTDTPSAQPRKHRTKDWAKDWLMYMIFTPIGAFIEAWEAIGHWYEYRPKWRQFYD